MSCKNTQSKQTTRPLRTNKIISWIYNLLFILISVQIFLGMFVTLAAEYYKYSFGQYIPPGDQNDIDFKFTLIQIYGIHSMLGHISAFPLFKKYRKQTNHFVSGVIVVMIKIWNLFVLTVLLDGFIVAWLIKKSCTEIHKSVEQILFRGMESYYSDSMWRLLWDSFQVNEQCCGVSDYRDWQSLAWLDIVGENQVTE